VNSDIRIVLFEAHHGRDIIVRPQDQYIKDSPLFDQWCAENEASAGFTAIRISDNKILGCGGVKFLWPGVGEGWAIFSDEIENYKRDCYEYATNYGSNLIREMKLHRIQATLNANNSLAIKFAESIGLVRECLMKGYGYDGSDYYLYSLLVNNRDIRLTTRQKVQVIENKIKEQSNHLEGDCFPLRHFFAKGLYGREISVPAGVLITSKIHKYSHFFFLLKGKIEVLGENGTEIFSAPKFFITEGGTKRAVSHLEDTIVMTVHATDKTDLKEIEDEIIAKDWNEIDSDREAVCLL
jgi:hypothetical protein